MVQVASLFNQLLDHFPKVEFDGLVRKHEADKGAKGFATRTQLVAMFPIDKMRHFVDTLIGPCPFGAGFRGIDTGKLPAK